MDVERGKRSAAKEVGGETLLSVVLLECLAPVHGGEVEDTRGGPPGQEREQVAKVGPGLESVELATRQERDEGGVDRAGFVRAHEEPVLPPDDLTPKRELADVVVHGQARVVE